MDGRDGGQGHVRAIKLRARAGSRKILFANCVAEELSVCAVRLELFRRFRSVRANEVAQVRFASAALGSWNLSTAGQMVWRSAVRGTRTEKGRATQCKVTLNDGDIPSRRCV